MRRTNKREFNFNHPSPQEYDLNKSSVGCAPCLNEVSKIEKGIKNRSLNEIKIDEIKRIVNSIFEGKKTSD
tara:strand:- start:600 stop:812 length:213 start_codon:yes stop_codon:yes gene_type:complete